MLHLILNIEKLCHGYNVFVTISVYLKNITPEAKIYLARRVTQLSIFPFYHLYWKGTILINLRHIHRCLSLSSVVKISNRISSRILSRASRAFILFIAIYLTALNSSKDTHRTSLNSSERRSHIFVHIFYPRISRCSTPRRVSPVRRPAMQKAESQSWERAKELRSRSTLPDPRPTKRSPRALYRSFLCASTLREPVARFVSFLPTFVPSSNRLTRPINQLASCSPLGLPSL